MTKKLPTSRVGSKGSGLAELRSKLPAATAQSASSARTDGAPLQMRIPAKLLHELKVRAAVEDSTVRALVLDALRQAGYKVSEDDVRDRRRAS